MCCHVGCGEHVEFQIGTKNKYWWRKEIFQLDFVSIQPNSLKRNILTYDFDNDNVTDDDRIKTMTNWQ